MTHYASGRAVEWKARDELTRAGYTVIRSAGSKGPVDLVAFDGKGVLLVQVKATRRKVVSMATVNDALMQMAELPRPKNARCQVWAYARGQCRKFRLTKMNGKMWSAEAA